MNHAQTSDVQLPSSAYGAYIRCSLASHSLSSTDLFLSTLIMVNHPVPIYTLWNELMEKGIPLTMVCQHTMRVLSCSYSVKGALESFSNGFASVGDMKNTLHCASVYRDMQEDVRLACLVVTCTRNLLVLQGLLSCNMIQTVVRAYAGNNDLDGALSYVQDVRSYVIFLSQNICQTLIVTLLSFLSLDLKAFQTRLAFSLLFSTNASRETTFLSARR